MANLNPDSSVVPPAFCEGETEKADTDVLLHPYGVGIDTHSRFIQVCLFLQCNQQILRFEREFTTDWTDLKATKKWIHDTLTEHNLPVENNQLHYTIESTGTYHFPVLRALEGRPRVMNPMLAGATKRKTDALDARLLAHHDMTGLWRDSYIYEDEIEVLRVMLNMRRHWQQHKTRTSNRISGFLLRFGHTLTSYARVGSAYTTAIIEDLVKGKTPDAPGVCETPLLPEARQILDEMLITWRYAKEREQEALDRARQYCAKCEFVLGTGEVVTGQHLMKLLQTVPGIGQAGALTWCAEVGWSGRFPNAKACAAYAGTDPTLKVSAGKVTNHTRRGGNRHLHKALTLAAGSLIGRKKEPFGQWGYRLMKSKAKGGYRKACGAVARRLCVALYHVHRTGEQFSYDKYNFWRHTEVKEVPLSEMQLGRFEPLLRRLGCETSTDVANKYFSDLAAEKGVGEKCLEVIRTWIQDNALVSARVARSSDARVRNSATRLVRGLGTASPQTKESSS